LAYRWDGVQLKYAVQEGSTETDETVLADLSKIFDANGEVVDTPEAKEGLETIAKAYGYEGSVEEFLALCNVVTDPNSGAEMRVTAQNMLANLASGSAANQFPIASETITFSGRVYDGATVNYNTNSGKFDGINGNPRTTGVVFGFSALGGNFSDITMDFTESSMFDNKGTSTIASTRGDFTGLGAGRRLGDMIGVSIQNNGMIYATYDNGMTKLVGQIATAEFANASGLEKKGDNLYAEP
jgi:flagellar hook protein FlgE